MVRVAVAWGQEITNGSNAALGLDRSFQDLQGGGDDEAA